jgi:hypothetical protein
MTFLVLKICTIYQVLVTLYLSSIYVPILIYRPCGISLTEVRCIRYFNVSSLCQAWLTELSIIYFYFYYFTEVTSVLVEILNLLNVSYSDLYLVHVFW